MNKKEKIFVTIIVLIVLIGWVYSAYWFPPDICERQGGSWDSWTIECAEKGETTWDRWFPKEEDSCKQTCECLESCRGRNDV